MESSIWKGSSSSNARDTYIELASKYKQKHGSLSGFLKENGALLIDGNLHKVRVSGDRFKLANLWSYNKYQTLRRSREGYNNIRKDLEKLGVDKSEINAFIAKDKKLYKSKVKGFASDDTLGHVVSLEKGGRDGSWNIEGEPAPVNYGKKGKSPSSNALLAEGVPRNTGEAYIKSQDPSGLPDPSEFTAAERAELRKLTTADEVNDFLAKKYSQGNNKNSNPLARIANTVRQQPSAGQVKPGNSGLAALADNVRGQPAIPKKALTGIGKASGILTAVAFADAIGRGASANELGGMAVDFVNPIDGGATADGTLEGQKYREMMARPKEHFPTTQSNASY